MSRLESHSLFRVTQTQRPRSTHSTYTIIQVSCHDDTAVAVGRSLSSIILQYPFLNTKHVLDFSTDADPTRNARLRGTANKTSSNKTPQSPATDDVHHHMPSPSNHSVSSQSSANLSSKLPPLPASPSLSQSIGMMGTGEEALNAYHLPRPLPLWLNPTAAKHIVKGNFMTLSARPKTVEQGEWIAHQGRSLIFVSDRVTSVR